MFSGIRMASQILRDGWGKWQSIHWDSPRRSFWIGRMGFGFGGYYAGYNCHWPDLFTRPWGRYSAGDYRIVYFFGNLWRGLRCFLLPTRLLPRWR